MDYKISKHSTKSLEDIQKQFEEEQRKWEEYKEECRQFDIEHGFKTAIAYLKTGKSIGRDATLTYIPDEDMYDLYHQVSDGYDCHFWYEHKKITEQEVIDWVNLNKPKEGSEFNFGYINTNYVFCKKDY